MALVRPLLLLLAATLLSAQEAPKQISGGPGKALSPVEAQKLFRLPKGLRIELVASEPQIESPVAMAFDPRGRLWVVEMRDYPNGPAKGEPPQGRIKILEDKDNDGFFETSKIFADELLFANGLLHWKDGVIVTAAPYIVHLRDTEGDWSKVDKRDVLFEGFAALNPQLRVSHPNLGLDGWIYVANGLRGGAVKKPGDREAIKLGGMDFRFDPLYGGFEAVTGMGQFGNTFDDWGQRFVCDNRHHLRHIVLEDRYIKRNPNLAAPPLVHDISVLEDGPLSSGGKIYPLSKNWTTSSLHEGRFTAACGVFIYRGQLLPKDCQGAAFTCDPTGNLVHQEIMTQAGATFESRPPQKGVEFLASPDDWFRPVFLSHGPDDALYVVDMYRAVIEHPEFMPPELKQRPDLTLGKERGRIWRITPAEYAAGGPPARLGETSTANLVPKLADNRPWHRTTAQRLLLERQDPHAVEPLRKLLDSASPQARVHAAWLLESMVYLNEERLLKLLDDEHPRARENAVKLAEVRLVKSKAMQDKLLTMSADTDPRVRCQVALSLGQWDSDRIVPALAAIATHAGDDRWTRIAVASSLVAPEDDETLSPPKSRAFPVLEAIVRATGFRKLPKAQQASLLQDFAALMLNEPVGIKPAAMAQELRDPHLALALFNGFADGLARKGVRFDDYFFRAFPNPNNPTLMWLREFLTDTGKLAADAKVALPERLAAIRLLAHVSWPTGKATLPALLDDPGQEIRLAAVRALATQRDKEVPPILMKNWRSYTPALRREVSEAMFRSPDRILVFLAEIDAKRVKPGDLDALRTRQLLNHGQPNIRVLADKLLRGNLPADRQQVLKQYQAALTMEGDAKRGLEVFKKNCATCHRVAGVGIDVGPDIADTRTKTLAALLTDILSPNQAIDNNYVNYVVTTDDGKSATGIIVGETASSISLKRAEGQTETILRNQIEELSSTGVSLMPEGLEKTIPVAEMADLLAFLKNWRYLDGSVPLTK